MARRQAGRQAGALSSFHGSRTDVAAVTRPMSDT